MQPLLRHTLVENGRDWRSGPRSRPYTGPPESAALMAAICTFASEMLDAGTTEALARKLEPFVERAWALDPRGQVPQRFAYFGFSRRLNEAFESCWLPHRKLTSRLGMDSGRTTAGGLCGLTADRVPQLFWKKEFEARLSGMLPGLLPNHARRACSMWLVKAAEGCTWKEAAATLDIPNKSGRAISNKVVSLLNAQGTAERFDTTLRDVARTLVSNEPLVDYAVRRRDLVRFTVIEWEEWRTICRSAGVHPGKRGGRQRQTAAWLWADLTCGDYLLSPTFQGQNSESEREAYRRFVKGPLLDVEDILRQYGRHLIATDAKKFQVRVSKTTLE